MTKYNSFIFEGHGTSEVDGSYDPGAVSGGIRENDIADKIVTSAIKQLEGTGLAIHRDEQNYIDDDLKGNTYTSNCGIVVHINAGGGQGVEIYPPCKEGHLDSDFMITHAISQGLGIPNRGVKSRDYDSEATYKRINGQALYYKDYYKEVRQAWEKGISLSILEVGFIDSSDRDKILANIDFVGKCVAEYIAFNNGVTLKVAPKPPVATTTTPTTSNGKTYRVYVDGKKTGAYSNVDNILAQVKKGLDDKVATIEITVI